MSEEQSPERKRVQGVVESDRMDKTVTVTVERLVQHPLYGKHMRRKSTFMAHDPHNDAREGDLVEIESTRPLSRRKRWRIVRILRRAPRELAEPSELGESTEELPA
ncbi:MAG: 30S ribosomal protein S17 [Candidatus Brocadiaceae bacterium]|jgi:small subunit ribosomal protein S17